MQLILNTDQIRQKTRRMAFQIYENNFDEAVLVLAGIAGEGFVFAQRLADELRAIAPFVIELVQIELDKTQPAQPTIKLATTNIADADAIAATDLAEKVVIVVDDVLNTGRTLAFSLQPFLAASVGKLQVAVLIDRNHPRYPVAADYRGYALSTTLAEHVEVVLSDALYEGVYLR
jgi:pyrimidine operon attenuation protein / uracil phosphoribosyltransferase